MQPLRSVLMAFAERPDVAGVAIVSDDGLLVEASAPAGQDVDALAALAMSAMRSLDTLCDAGGAGELQQAVLDAADGSLIMQRLPSGALLIVMAASQADLGQLLYEVRRHGPSLMSLL